MVAAARFITLEFKYKVPYFLENGRYQNTGFSEKIDGEGRYYHKGLYLSEDKYSEIKRSKTKPVMWGGTLKEYSTGKYLKNGLDCSGFVTWAMYNGGYDPGDIGAGPGEWYKTLPDLGKSEPITLSLLKSGKVKAGDLLVEYDIDAIKKAGYPTITPIIITNTDNYEDVDTIKKGDVKEKDKLVSVR